jgi:acyl carrier protein
MEPVPIGVPGELYIGGAGVARGYLNRADLTAERFVPDGFSGDGGRLYRTGDLCRYLADGNIEFLGRNDDQVKIRGYRIELGEIESRLSEHADVREAVVIAREDTPGEKRLVGYYTADAAVSAETLRSHLLQTLPEYMVPAAYVWLAELPLTPNGKLDRKALPSPDVDAYTFRSYEAPQGEIETVLAEIWADLLKVNRVSRHDNFFELGGHSLLAIRLISRMRQALEIELPLSALFEVPTVAGIAERIASKLMCLEKERSLEQESLEQEMRTAISGLSYEELELLIAQKEGF